MADFDGLVAVVAGGSTGIGDAVVDRLAGDGARIVFCGHEAAGVAATQDRTGATGMVADVRSAPQMSALIEHAVDLHGGLDILVNAAGIQRYGTVEDTTEEAWNEVLDVNLKGMFLTGKYAVPHLRARGGGSIVNVSSVQAYATQDHVLGYSISKAGINALTRSMALDHAADGIRVNAVCPGSVDTPMLRASAEQFKGEDTAEETVVKWGRTHPLGRVARPAEVAEVVAFLAGPRSSFVTGSEYRVDGGLLNRLAATL
ncbi:MAG TPA: SDR family oxidoreductase [Mycobacteriales bacterium]|nr:SDR family oxidoreductase [Mycobacteriales bacterium]